MYLDDTLNLNLHIKEKMSKNLIGIDVIKKLSKALLVHYFVTIYKSFVRLHIDYGEFIYDQLNDERVEKLKEFYTIVQYNATLAITGAIKGVSQNKLYSKLVLESLKFQRWYGKLYAFLKTKTFSVAEYFFDHIPPTNHLYNIR